MAISVNNTNGGLGMKRVILDFSPSTYQALEEFAKARGSSLSEALRDAIALSKWFKDTQDQGANILVERDGQLREVVKIW